MKYEIINLDLSRLSVMPALISLRLGKQLQVQHGERGITSLYGGILVIVRNDGLTLDAGLR